MEGGTDSPKLFEVLELDIVLRNLLKNTQVALSLVQGACPSVTRMR